MKYAAEMGLGTMIYMPDLIKIGSAIQKLRGIYRHSMVIV
jgi:hypothetical protein